LPEALALVDSGADRSIFPAAWAPALGIDLDQDCEQAPGNTAGGATTNFNYAAGIEAIFMGKRIKLFATFNPGLPLILLGREDFFDTFHVSFDQRAKTMTISEYEASDLDAEADDEHSVEADDGAD
jgi:hypothetical protein